MNETIQFKSEGTSKPDFPKNEADLLGKLIDIYSCSSSLPYSASVDRYLGAFIGTNNLLNVEESSYGALFDNIQKEEPVLRVVNKEQEGRAITFQKWKGVVKNIQEETFIARVIDLVRNDVVDEEVELFLADIQDDDKELLSVGAVFYWCIGYVYSPSNSVTRASFLRFQRLPLHSQRSIELSAQKVKDIQNDITWL